MSLAAEVAKTSGLKKGEILLLRLPVKHNVHFSRPALFPATLLLLGLIQ